MFEVAAQPRRRGMGVLPVPVDDLYERAARAGLALTGRAPAGATA